MANPTLVRTLTESGVLRRLMLLAVAVAAVVALLAGLIVALTDGGHAAPAPSTSHAVRIDNPAVVRILTVWEGRLICHGCGPRGADLTSPNGGGTFETTDSGSGAFISPDGYVLTADHVTEHSTNNPDDVQALLGYAADDFTSRFGFSASEWLQFFQSEGSTIELKISTAKAQVFLATGYTGKLQNTAQVTGFQIQRVVASSPVYKQDTSIIKVEAHDMPYLTLASGAGVNPGDTVTSIGFPGDADSVLNGGDFTALLNLTNSDVNTVNSLLSSSVQTGQVTATKNLTDGTPVYETSGISSQGSSGGPVINPAGQIIGFVDAGPSDHRLSFLIPSTVVAEYAHEANVSSPPQGAFMGQWTSAINDYDATTGVCHLTHATSALQQLRDQYPGFGAAQGLLGDAQSHAGSENCPSPVGVGLAAGGIAGLLALIAGAILAYSALRRGVTLPALVSARMRDGSYAGMRPSGPGYPPVSGPPFIPPSPQTLPGQPWGSAGAAYPADPYAGQFPPQATYPGAYPSGPGAPQSPGMASPAPATPAFPGGPYPPGPATFPPQPASGPLGSTTLNASQPAYPQPPSVPGMTPGVTRVCSNGHTVADAAATACPFCGATVWEIPTQA